ncbi:DUF1592 domain-containing protein [Vibrio sp.]|nr:DUF1592 domain-containing protein [Vibrio sp.]
MSKALTFTVLATSVAASFSVSAAEEWQGKSYGGGSQVCYDNNLYEAKWWASSSTTPDPNGPTNENQPGWGTQPWLLIEGSSECATDPEPENNPPIIQVSTLLNLTSPLSDYQLQATATDLDNDTLSYVWTKISGSNDVSMAGSSTASPRISIPSLESNQTFVYQLEVSDGTATVSETITLQIQADPETLNSEPIANVVQSVLSVQSPSNNVQLDASNSYDPDSDALSFIWSQVSGPTVSIQNQTSAVAMINIPELQEDANYTFKVAVSDGELTSEKTVTVQATTVTVNIAPVLSWEKAKLKSAAGRVVSFNISVEDEQPSQMKYRWKQTVGDLSIPIENNNALDAKFDLRGASAGDYKFRLVATDSEGLKAKKTFTVTVNDTAISNGSFIGKTYREMITDESADEFHFTVSINDIGLVSPEVIDCVVELSNVTNGRLAEALAECINTQSDLIQIGQKQEDGSLLVVRSNSANKIWAMTNTMSVDVEFKEPLIEQGSVTFSYPPTAIVTDWTGNSREVDTFAEAALNEHFEATFTSQSGDVFSFNSQVGSDFSANLKPGTYQLWIEMQGAWQSINSLQTINIIDDQIENIEVFVKPSIDTDTLSAVGNVSIEPIIDGIFQPRQMVYGDGYLFVGASAIFDEYGDRGNKVYAVPFDHTTGEVGTPIILADELLEGHGVAYRNGHLYYSTAMHIMVIKDVLTQLSTPIPEIVTALPAAEGNFELLSNAQRNIGLFWHQKHTLKFNSQDPNDASLYVSIGSPCNVCIIDEEPEYGTIVKIDVETGESHIVANGIRNTVGFDWDPETGDIWFTDNNRQISDNTPVYYPGEINKILASDLEQNTVPHFGFPYLSGISTSGLTKEQFAGTSSTSGVNYLPEGAIFTDLQENEINLSDYHAPEFELEAGSAALGLQFWQPNTESSNRSIIYATHGPGDGDRAGYELRQLTLDSVGSPIFDKALVTGFKQSGGIVGKPVEMLTLPDNSMLVSDDHGNTIYRVSYDEQADTGSVQFSISMDEENANDLAEMNLVQPNGISRRLYVDVNESNLVLEGLALGNYQLVIAQYGELNPSQSVIPFSITNNDSPTIVSWSYQDNQVQEGFGTITVDAPEKPSGSGSYYTLVLEPSIEGPLPDLAEQSNVVYDPVTGQYTIELEWGIEQTLFLPAGSYNVYPSYTGSSVPSDKIQSITIIEGESSPQEIEIEYTEFESNQAYFNYVYNESCAQCHESHNAPSLFSGPSDTMVANYTLNQDAIQEKVAQMDAFGWAICDVNCQETMATYLEELWVNDLPSIDEPVGDINADRGLRLLSSREYVNTIRDVFNINIDSSLLPVDRFSGTFYSNPIIEGQINSSDMSKYAEAAITIQSQLDINAVSNCPTVDPNALIPSWENRIYGTQDKGVQVVHNGIVYENNYWTNAEPGPSTSAPTGQPWIEIGPAVSDPSRSPEAVEACFSTWVANTGEKLFHRPLTNVEKSAYSPSEPEASLSAMLTSPNFLFRREIGSVNQQGTFSLNSYEVATMLSYTLWGSVPDDVLWDKAKNGTIKNANVLNAEINRMLNDSKAHKQFSHFMMQTMEFDEHRVLVNYGSLTEQIGQAMLDEFELYVSDAVFGSDKGTFADLMAGDTTFVSPLLASHYGYNTSGEVNIPSERGKGILSLGAVNVAYSTEVKTRPIPRARMVQFSLLGWEFNQMVGTKLGDLHNDSSTREYWDQLTGPSTGCWGCHIKMNDIGSAMNTIDKDGKFRRYENYVSDLGIDYPNTYLQTQGELVDVDNQTYNFADLAELADVLAQSQDARRTMVRNYFEYVVGKRDASYTPLYTQNGDFEDFRALIKIILTSDAVLERKE